MSVWRTVGHIRSGPKSSRNAIKLLELKKYPKSIVKEANYLANQFGRKAYG